MMAIEWLPQAQTDLMVTLTWLLSCNALSAEKTARDIQRAVELAATFPMANPAARTEF
jgi:plasmid stabilization system protein ParE